MASLAQIERIGHRGAPNERLENTLASFRRAVELGATAVELDVHVSLDGVPVVHHDPALHRDVSPKRFANAALAVLDSREVADVRLNSGDAVPFLADVLRALTPTTKVYVEIKGGSPTSIARVIDPFRGSVAVHSFDHDAIVEMARLASDIPRGILLEHPTDDLASLVRRTGASDVWPAYRLVDELFMARATSCGVRVIPWTVNSRRAIRHLTELAVAGICTNDLSLFDAR